MKEDILYQLGDRFELREGLYPDSWVANVRFLVCKMLKRICALSPRTRMGDSTQEKQVLLQAARAIKAKMESIPGGTHDEDLALLENNKEVWGVDLKLAFGYRIEQKKILSSNHLLVLKQIEKEEALASEPEVVEEASEDDKLHAMMYPDEDAMLDDDEPDDRFDF